MRSKLNRMMAKGKPHMPAYVPTKAHRELRILDKTKPLHAAPSAEKWHLVMVEPRCEEKAVQSLHEAGYLAWHPQLTMWVSSARMKTRTKVNRPLFARYLFVAYQPGVSKSIIDCDHVSKVIGEMPSIRERDKGLLAELSSRQTQGEFDISKPVEPFAAGQQVTVANDGPFRDLAGIVQKSEVERTTILMEIFGSWQKVEVETAALKKVA